MKTDVIVSVMVILIVIENNNEEKQGIICLSVI